MTCAKVRVTAVLLTLDGDTFHGENICKKPQTACPRETGEGYQKCVEICEQECHAEVAAVRACLKAGGDPKFGSMVVNYHYICDDCKRYLDGWGIRYIC